MAEKILLVEDEEKLARMVEMELRYEGYQVTKAFDGRSGLEEALSGKHDLVLLDIMLPQLSGMEVLRRLRRESQVPVIMLTARDSVIDKVSGLDSGADDYITKPFAIEELLARIRAALRNKAEMAVRQQDHEDRLNAMRANGVRLVICSTHADCSQRCRPYQGRVYSLDGTRGRTDDGRDFVPLEEATQNPRDRYVTKAGRVWQNGLLSFNCRHFLVEYKSGYRFPEPDAKAERKEYMITETQRRLERNVRDSGPEFPDIHREYGIPRECHFCLDIEREPHPAI